jgi:hypothetical protein
MSVSREFQRAQSQLNSPNDQADNYGDDQNDNSYHPQNRSLKTRP